MKLLKTQVNMIRARVRRGLTLIELVVVMSILIALAGLLVPMLPGMLTRAHTSTCSTNMGEVAKSIGEYYQLYSAYPANMDSLVDSTGNLITYLANGAACPAQYQTGTGVEGGGQFSALTLNTNEIAALEGSGLLSFQKMAAYPSGTTGVGTFDPTFNYYADYLTPGQPAANATVITGASTALTLAGVDPVNGGATSPAYALCIHIGLPTTGRYVALGVGQRCSMIGKTMLSAPVHYGDVPVLNPEYGYQRLVALFKVSDTALTSYPEAQLVAVGPIHDDGLGSIGDETQNWYQISQ